MIFNPTALGSPQPQMPDCLRPGPKSSIGRPSTQGPGNRQAMLRKQQDLKCDTTGRMHRNAAPTYTERPNFSARGYHSSPIERTGDFANDYHKQHEEDEKKSSQGRKSVPDKVKGFFKGLKGHFSRKNEPQLPSTIGPKAGEADVYDGWRNPPKDDYYTHKTPPTVSPSSYQGYGNNFSSKDYRRSADDKLGKNFFTSESTYQGRFDENNNKMI